MPGLLPNRLPRARGFFTTPPTLTNSSNIPLKFDTNQYDTQNIHVVGDSKFVAKVNGLFFAFSGIAFAGQSPTPAGVRGVGVAIDGNINNSDFGTLVEAKTTNFLEPLASGMIVLNVGQYVEFVAFQSSGGDLALLGGFGALICMQNFGVLT